MKSKQGSICIGFGTRLFACAIIVFILLCGVGPYLGHDTKSEDSVDQTTITTTVETESEVPETSTSIPDIETSLPSISVPEFNAPAPSKPIPPVSDDTSAPYITLTESEQLILATLIRLEAGGSPYETKLAVASVVINRMKMWGLSLRDVVFAKNVFSPAHLIDKETGKSHYNPPKEGAYAPCWQAVEEICQNGPSIPSYVIYFRAGQHHTWATPYAKIGSMYFSYATKYVSVCKYCKEMFAKYEISEHQKECSAK